MKIAADLSMLADPTGRDLPSQPERAGEAFEALLISEVWKQALDGPRLSNLLDGGSASRMFRELQVEAISARMAARGGFGLARGLAAHRDGEPGA